MTTTTASLSWTVPGVSSNPENYTVTFNGLELQPESREIEWIVSNTTNVPTAGFLYQVELEGLEEANTYNYTVQPTKCKGMTTTDAFQFTTLPDSELANHKQFYFLLLAQLYN